MWCLYQKCPLPHVLHFQCGLSTAVSVGAGVLPSHLSPVEWPFSGSAAAEEETVAGCQHVSAEVVTGQLGERAHAAMAPAVQ